MYHPFGICRPSQMAGTILVVCTSFIGSPTFCNRKGRPPLLQVCLFILQVDHPRHTKLAGYTLCNCIRSSGCWEYTALELWWGQKRLSPWTKLSNHSVHESSDRDASLREQRRSNARDSTNLSVSHIIDPDCLRHVLHITVDPRQDDMHFFQKHKELSACLELEVWCAKIQFKAQSKTIGQGMLE